MLRAMDVPAATEALDELVQTGMTRSRAAELVYGERATPVVRFPRLCAHTSYRRRQQRSSVRTLCHPPQQNDVQSWAQYMACDGLGGSEYRCVALKYCEGLRPACMHSSAFMSNTLPFSRFRRAAGCGGGPGGARSCLRRRAGALRCAPLRCLRRFTCSCTLRAGLATELRRSIHVVQVHGADAGFADEAALFFLPHHPLAHAAAAAAATPPLFLIMRGTGWTGSGGDHFEPCLARAAPPGTVPAFTL